MLAGIASVLDVVGLGELVRGKGDRSVQELLLLAGAPADAVADLDFFDGTFQQAIQTGKREHKFVAALLFAPEHDDAAAFAQVLTDPQVRSILKQEYILWGASVHTPAGMSLSFSLPAAHKFPLLTVLYMHMSEKVQLETVQGRCSVREMESKLRGCMESAGALLVTQRADRMESEARRQLQEEQEAALRDAERLDRERAAQRAEEEERQQLQREEEERLKQEAEEQQRQEEIKEAMRLAQLHSLKEAKAEELGEEPPEGDDVATIRVRMLDGTQVQRRFCKTDTISRIAAFVVSHSAYDGRKDFEISTPYPVKVLPPESTIAAEGLFPRSVVVAKEI